MKDVFCLSEEALFRSVEADVFQSEEETLILPEFLEKGLALSTEKVLFCEKGGGVL